MAINCSMYGQHSRFLHKPLNFSFFSNCKGTGSTTLVLLSKSAYQPQFLFFASLVLVGSTLPHQVSLNPFHSELLLVAYSATSMYFASCPMDVLRQDSDQLSLSSKPLAILQVTVLLHFLRTRSRCVLTITT